MFLSVSSFFPVSSCFFLFLTVFFFTVSSCSFLFLSVSSNFFLLLVIFSSSFFVSSRFFLFQLVLPVSSSLFFKFNFRCLALIALAFLLILNISSFQIVCQPLSTQGHFVACTAGGTSYFMARISRPIKESKLVFYQRLSDRQVDCLIYYWQLTLMV